MAGSAELAKSDQSLLKLNSLGRLTVEGDSPVYVRQRLLCVAPSSTEPLKFRVNLAGPPVKPKYSSVTDSGQVP